MSTPSSLPAETAVPAVPHEAAMPIIWDMPIWAPLTAIQRQKLLAEAKRVHFLRGQPVFSEGDPCIGFYMVLTGLVKISHFTLDGKEMVLHLIRPGNSFGEAFVFRQGEYPMSATAVESTETLFVPAELMRRLTRENPELAEKMLNVLATRLYMFTRKLQAQSLREAPQRLAAYLMHTSRLRGHSAHITLDMSREVLAQMLGTARETISRTLTKLAERGVISVSGRQVQLTDMAALQSIAEGREEL